MNTHVGEAALLPKTDKVIIVGDFNIHVYVENDSLGTAFLSQLDSFGFCQCVHEPTHTFNHTLDLVLTYGIEIKYLNVSAQNLVLSDHYLLTFDFLLINYKPRATSYHGRCISEETVENFKEIRLGSDAVTPVVVLTHREGISNIPPHSRHRQTAT